MALIEMSSVEENILALIVCGIVLMCVIIAFVILQAAHNYPISSTSHLQVSFTKSTI